jgi:hypothetical protein
MPSTSKAQHNLMAMVANDPAAAKRMGISQKVGREFMKADKGRKFNEGGDMKESKAMMGKELAFMKKKGAPKAMIKHEMAEAKGMKKGGATKKMMGGGMAYKSGGYTSAADGVAKKGKTKGTMVKMAYGGKC